MAFSRLLWATVAVGLLGGAGVARAAGMPQLNPEVFPPQLVWLAVSFLILYLVMARIALPRVSQVLEERQDRIESDLKKAEQLKGDAEAAERAYEAGLAEARAKAQAAIRAANQAASEKAQQDLGDLAARLAGEVARAEAAIAEARDAAMANLEAVSVELARATAERLAGFEVDERTARAAYDAVTRERQ